MKRYKGLEEAAEKILRGEHALNESISSNDIIQSQSALGGELYRLKTKLVDDGGLMPAEWSAGAFKSKDGNWKGRLTAISSMMKGWVSDKSYDTPLEAIQAAVDEFEATKR